MQRFDSETATRIRLFVPSFLVRQPTLSLPPPVPGSAMCLEELLVGDEGTKVPKFLVPWPAAMPSKTTSKREEIVDWGLDPHNPIPCEVDKEALANWVDHFGVRNTVNGILKKCAPCGGGSGGGGARRGEEGEKERSEVCDSIVASLGQPFASSHSSCSGAESIVWTLDRRVRVDPTVDARVATNHGPKKSVNKNSSLTRSSDGWSIRCFVSGPPARPRNHSGGRGGEGDAYLFAADATAREQREAIEICHFGSSAADANSNNNNNNTPILIPTVRKNVIYNGDGVAIAQVDFGHGASVGTHVHSLAENNLDHVAVAEEDHLFHFPSVPWAWLCIPIDPSFLLSDTVTKSFFREHAALGRTSSEPLISSALQRAVSKAQSKGVHPQQIKATLQAAAEANPFVGHFPADRPLTYRLPSTIDWDVYGDSSWRWLAISLPFEDYSASGLDFGGAYDSD